MATTASDRAEFREFCRNATTRQLPHIIGKEREAAMGDPDREIYAEIAEEEMRRRDNAGE